MTRVVSVSAHTGPVKVSIENYVDGRWEAGPVETLKSGEHKTSVTLSDTARLVIEEVAEQPDA